MELLYLSLGEITVRMALAVLAGGIIGYEREKKGREAGFRTHILVAVGACILALIQVHTTIQTLEMAKLTEQAPQVLSADNTRLIAQIVSGIGFLGAGTILVSHGNIRGLTTAASIWTSAALGIALGMGYYRIAGAGLIVTMITLLFIKRVFRFPNMKILRVEYVDAPAYEKAICAYFAENRIRIMKAVDSVATAGASILYHHEYKIDIRGKKLPEDKIVKDLERIGDFLMLELTDLNEDLE